MRVTARHRRDFAAYLRWRREWDSPFNPNPQPLLPRGGASALSAFVALESRGLQPAAVRQPRLFRAAVEGKALLNWQIKQWAAGMALARRESGSFGAWVAVIELRGIVTAFPWLPAWVWEAVARQAGVSRPS